MADTVRIALVADIHHGADTYTKKGSAALPLMAEFHRFVADAQPDLVLDLGDRISDEDPVTDAKLQAEVADAFKPVMAQAPVYHLCGNHDRDFLSVAANERILRQALQHNTIDAGDWRIVLWRADTLIRRPGGFQFSDDDLAWLDAVVAAADRPLLFVSHVPVSGHGQTGNYYFERNPASSTYPEAARIRAVLRRLEQPAAWIAGHVHWNTVTTVDGIAHLTQQSLTETFTTGGEAAGAFGLLELGPATLDWQVFGQDAYRTTLPVAQMGRRWVPPLPPFSELPHNVEREARLQAYHTSVAAE